MSLFTIDDIIDSVKNADRIAREESQQEIDRLRALCKELAEALDDCTSESWSALEAKDAAIAKYKEL